MATKTPKEIDDFKKRYEEYQALYSRGGNTGNVRATGKGFSAVVIRKGDGPQDIRGVEAVLPGEVVDIRIDSDPNAVQGANAVALIRAKGGFEPAGKAEKTDPPADDPFHGTKSTAQVMAERTNEASKHGNPDEVLHITRGQLESIITEAINASLLAEDEPAPAAGTKKK